MHTSRMRTARSLPYRGGLSLRRAGSPWQRPPGQRPPRQRPPWTETPLDRDTPGQRPPGQRPPLDRDPLVMWPKVKSIKSICWKFGEKCIMFTKSEKVYQACDLKKETWEFTDPLKEFRAKSILLLAKIFILCEKINLSLRHFLWCM